MDYADKAAAPRGHLILDVFQHGKLIEHWDGPNLIVDGAKSLLASLLGGSNSGKFVNTIGFGTNATPPATGNTALTGAFTKAVDSVTFPSTGLVTFNFSLGTSEANGTAISEFGLITGNGTLFSRRVRANPITKDNTISFTGTWSIQF